MEKNKAILVSVIVTTYNWPEALRAVLIALMHQTHLEFEIIIADDGSNHKTEQLIKQMIPKMPVPLHHVFQEDKGFRVSAIRNKAILKAQGDYILFLDGDCIPTPQFISEHLALQEKGYFVAGNRVLLNRAFTIKVLSEDLKIHTWPFWRWVLARCLGHCNRILPFLKFPLAARFRKANPLRYEGAMGCHLGVWRSDLLRVNGWEEKFEGWGFEDSDLVLRLIKAGIRRKEARFRTPVIHLWHPFHSRETASHNWARLERQKEQHSILAEQGLNQYLNCGYGA